MQIYRSAERLFGLPYGTEYADRIMARGLDKPPMSSNTYTDKRAHVRLTKLVI